MLKPASIRQVRADTSRLRDRAAGRHTLRHRVPSDIALQGSRVALGCLSAGATQGGSMRQHTMQDQPCRWCCHLPGGARLAGPMAPLSRSCSSTPTICPFEVMKVG